MIVKKGYSPPPGAEVTDVHEQFFTRKGFFGSYALLYKSHSAGKVVRADKELGPFHIDLRRMKPSDMDKADGFPASVVVSEKVKLYVSRRRAPMPFCWRNADGDELYFIHRGQCRFDTEFGQLKGGPGDFVFLPRNVVYKVLPETEDNLHLILETQELMDIADQYHRQHGMTLLGIDQRALVVPELIEQKATSSKEYEVKTKKGGAIRSIVFDHDPVGVTLGWAGDPIVFKLSALAIPSARSPFPPPTSAVFMTPEDCVVSVRRWAPGRIGAPAHSNDWDELWFLHSSSKPESKPNAGMLRFDPQGVTQAGSRYTHPKDPKEPPDPNHININIDVGVQLRLSEEAVPCLVEGSFALDP